MDGSTWSLALEQKATLVVLCFAVVKAASTYSPFSEAIAVNIFRAFFVVAHSSIALAYLQLTSRINSSRSLLIEEKVERKASLNSACKAILVRAAIVIAIHFRLKLNPPLLVSSVLGLISIAEIDPALARLLKP